MKKCTPKDLKIGDCVWYCLNDTAHPVKSKIYDGPHYIYGDACYSLEKIDMFVNIHYIRKMEYKDYTLKVINPYNSQSERPEIIFKNVPEDFKFCETDRYTNNVTGELVQFFIFFYEYNEELFNQINELCEGRNFGNIHTHAYKINDYMVGNFWSVSQVSELPTETIEELNGRFLSVFKNHLIKIEEETLSFRAAEQEFRNLSIEVGEDKFENWTEERKQLWEKAKERFVIESKKQFHTTCIRRFIGFQNRTQQLEINTACIWFEDEIFKNPGACLISRENDQWFMLMNAYNSSVPRRITISDSIELWDELKQRQKEITDMFENH